MERSSLSAALIAAMCVVAAMAVLGLSDNLVGAVAEEVGLWQFHMLRAMLGLPLILLAAWASGQRLRPVRIRAVAVRSFLVSLSMVFYFGALAFVPVAQSAAGLFTAPIWVLLISVALLGQRVSGLNVLAVIVGFGGALLVLQPDVASLSLALLMPVAAGVLYALGAIATRRLCAEETTFALLVGFFVAMVLWGALGCLTLALWQPGVPDGADGFLLRGWQALSIQALGLIAIQALGAVIGLALIFRAYLLAEAPFIAVFEYTLLIFGGFWGWMLWGQGMNGFGFAGIGLIIASGIVLARSERGSAVPA